MTDLTLGSGVTRIDYEAFRECSALEELTIPGSVTTIAGGAFQECGSLKAVTLPDSVMELGQDVFYGCSALQRVEIGSGVLTIPYEAFEYCSGLTTLVLSDGVKTVESYAFHGCDALTDVYYVGTEAQWGRITIKSHNEPLLNATMHYNYVHSHELVKTEAVAATCTEPGSIEYWTCSLCGRYFSDGNGETE